MKLMSRKQGEVIRIGEDIVVTVLDTNRRYAKIGIDAPREIEIVSAHEELRKETINKRQMTDD